MVHQKKTCPRIFLKKKKNHNLILVSDLSLKSQALFVIYWLPTGLALCKDGKQISLWLVHLYSFPMEERNSICHLVCIESGGEWSIEWDWRTQKGSQVSQFGHSHVSTCIHPVHFCHDLIDNVAGIALSVWNSNGKKHIFHFRKAEVCKCPYKAGKDH